MLANLQIIKEWWAEHVNKQPVWRIEDLPSSQYKKVLLSLNLAYEIRRDIIVLGKPETDVSILIHSYFWEIVSCILKPYAPYAITGLTAIHCYLGDKSIPNELEVFTKSSSIKIDIHKISLIVLEKNPIFYQQAEPDKNLQTINTAKNYLLTLESPESLLMRLRTRYFRDYPQVISSFLKAIDFDKERMMDLLFHTSKPVTHLRLAGLFEQVGKFTEAKLLNNNLKLMTTYAAPGKAQIIKYPFPSVVAYPKKLSDPVYVVRFRDQLRIYKDRVNTHFKKLKLPNWSLKKILAYADKTKKYDTYHSSTIEGYRVTPEEIQMLIDGRETLPGGSREEIERRMALKGYLEAHKFLLQIIEKDFKSHNSLSEIIIREIYAHLFLPTIEAGLLAKEQLTQYRNDAVFIRSSRYVPPNYQKINDLMRCLVEEVNEAGNNIATKAIIAHYGFVTIHPYFDGNGRVARFLMNYLFCCAGIPWITIRIEDRDSYFRSLEIAQCDDDIKPFAELMTKYLEESRLFK